MFQLFLQLAHTDTEQIPADFFQFRLIQVQL